jgi:hypothetical protein
MVVVATVMPEAAGGRSTRPCRPLDLATISQSGRWKVPFPSHARWSRSGLKLRLRLDGSSRTSWIRGSPPQLAASLMRRAPPRRTAWRRGRFVAPRCAIGLNRSSIFDLDQEWTFNDPQECRFMRTEITEVERLPKQRIGHDPCRPRCSVSEHAGWTQRASQQRRSQYEARSKNPGCIPVCCNSTLARGPRPRRADGAGAGPQGCRYSGC